MDLSWPDIAIHKDHYDGPKLLIFWSWLVDENYGILLPSTMGDLLLERRDNGTIWFLDAANGKLEPAAPDYDSFKQCLNDLEKVNHWFSTNHLGQLLTAGLHRNPDECFSPIIPYVAGGKTELANFTACKLLAHHALHGAVHEQIRHLPPGTPISGIDLIIE